MDDEIKIDFLKCKGESRKLITYLTKIPGADPSIIVGTLALSLAASFSSLLQVAKLTQQEKNDALDALISLIKNIVTLGESNG